MRQTVNRPLKHENQACPPSLSNLGKLRLATKPDIASCLEKLVVTQTDSFTSPTVDTITVDGASKFINAYESVHYF